MIAQRGGITQRVVHDLHKIREWVREQIKVRQKFELDGKVKKIDVKKLLKRRVIISLRKGVGRGLGKKLGGFARRLDRTVAKLFGF